jgi:hypothetical protein
MNAQDPKPIALPDTQNAKRKLDKYTLYVFDIENIDLQAFKNYVKEFKDSKLTFPKGNKNICFIKFKQMKVADDACLFL